MGEGARDYAKKLVHMAASRRSQRQVRHCGRIKTTRQYSQTFSSSDRRAMQLHLHISIESSQGMPFRCSDLAT